MRLPVGRLRILATTAHEHVLDEEGNNPGQPDRLFLHGYRLASLLIEEEFNHAPVLHLLLRYTQALITQMSQTAGCAGLSWS